VKEEKIQQTGEEGLVSADILKRLKRTSGTSLKPLKRHQCEFRTKEVPFVLWGERHGGTVGNTNHNVNFETCSNANKKKMDQRPRKERGGLVGDQCWVRKTRTGSRASIPGSIGERGGKWGGSKPGSGSTNR